MAIYIDTRGAFSDAVAKALMEYDLASEANYVILARNGAGGQPWTNMSNDDCYVLVADVVRETQFRALASELWRHGISHLALALEDGQIITSHLIIPDVSPCWDCFRARYIGNAAIGRGKLALQSYYEDPQNQGPTGFMPYHTLLSASMIREMVRNRGRGEPEAEARFINLFTRASEKSKIVRRNDCLVCNPPDTRRTVRRLLEHLHGMSGEFGDGF